MPIIRNNLNSRILIHINGSKNIDLLEKSTAEITDNDLLSSHLQSLIQRGIVVKDKEIVEEVKKEKKIENLSEKKEVKEEEDEDLSGEKKVKREKKVENLSGEKEVKKERKIEILSEEKEVKEEDEDLSKEELTTN